jgi:uncharacterized membrane protein (DUF4010 family)
MQLKETSTGPAPLSAAGTHNPEGSAALPGVLGAAMTSLATLPQAFEQNPRGAVVVVGLLTFALICWVLVTWIKYQRD